jgi:outer membrane protein assembly factor BamB
MPAFFTRASRFESIVRYGCEAGLRLLLLVSGVLLVTACATLDNAEPPAELTEIADPLRLEQHWWIDSGEGIRQNYQDMRPLLVGDKVFTIDTQGEIKQIDVNSGDEDWSYPSGLAAITGLEGDEQHIVATSSKGEIVFYQRQMDGLEALWRARLASEIRSPARIDRDQVYVRGGDGKLHAFKMENGASAWVVVRSVPALSLTGTSRPWVHQELVIAGFDNGKLAAFDRTTGTTEWEVTIGSPRGRTEIERLVDVDGPFVIRDGVIYACSFQGNLGAISASSGQPIWSREFSSSQALAIDDEAIYLVDSSSHLWAIDRRTGSAFWKQDVLNARKITAPAISGNYLVLGDLEGYVHWFDKADGRLLGRLAVMDLRILSQPVAAGQLALFIDAGGELAAIAPKAE